MAEISKSHQKLKSYSEELEDKVAIRTSQLNEKNALLSNVLDSINQAILVFDESGNCLSVYSRQCEEILGHVPEGQKIETILGKDNATKTENWRKLIFSNKKVPFESLEKLAPRPRSFPNNKIVEITYSPLKDDNGELTSVILIGTDRTEEELAKQKLINKSSTQK